MIRLLSIPFTAPLKAAVAACLLAFLLSGCELLRELLPPVDPQSAASRTTAADPAAVRIAEAAIRAEEALAELARARAADNPVDAAVPPRLVPEVLLVPVTLDWVGPIDQLAAQLADKAGYAYIEAGTRPVIPVLVTLAATETPLVLVLRDAGIQAAAQARLTVDANAREVRIDWAAPAQQGETAT